MVATLEVAVAAVVSSAVPSHRPVVTRILSPLVVAARNMEAMVLIRPSPVLQPHLVAVSVAQNLMVQVVGAVVAVHGAVSVRVVRKVEMVGMGSQGETDTVAVAVVVLRMVRADKV